MWLTDSCPLHFWARKMQRVSFSPLLMDPVLSLKFWDCTPCIKHLGLCPGSAASWFCDWRWVGWLLSVLFSYFCTTAVTLNVRDVFLMAMGCFNAVVTGNPLSWACNHPAQSVLHFSRLLCRGVSGQDTWLCLRRMKERRKIHLTSQMFCFVSMA